MDRKTKILLVLVFLLVLLGSSLVIADVLSYYGRIVGTVTITTP